MTNPHYGKLNVQSLTEAYFQRESRKISNIYNGDVCIDCALLHSKDVVKF